MHAEDMYSRAGRTKIRGFAALGYGPMYCT